jgi:hypothetical protein
MLTSLKSKISKINDRILQEEIDVARALNLTEYYKANNWQIQKLNQDLTFKFKDMYDPSISKKITNSVHYTRRGELHIALSSQLQEMFEFIEKNGDTNPYPKLVEAKDKEKLAAVLMDSSLSQELQKIRRNEIEQAMYQPGTLLAHPSGFHLQIRKSRIDHPDSGYGLLLATAVILTLKVFLYKEEPVLVQ